jgi:hypothetical protein
MAQPDLNDLQSLMPCSLAIDFAKEYLFVLIQE